MSITTEDCRKFIVDFEARNPQIELARFDGAAFSPEEKEALLNPKSWKRLHKVKPDSSTDDHERVESYSVYVDGQPVNRYAEPQRKILASEIKWERSFNCEPFEGQIAYLILETNDGELLFGNYVGD